MSYTRYSFWVTAVLFAGETVPTELCSSRLWPCDSAQPLDQGDRVGQRAHRKLEAFHASNPVHEALHAAAIQPFGQDEALAEDTPQRLRPAHGAQLADHVGHLVRKDDSPDGAAPSRVRRAFGRIQVIHSLPIFPQVRGS